MTTRRIALPLSAFRRIKNNPPCGLSSLARGIFLFGSNFPKTDCNFSAVNIACAVICGNVRHAVATIEVIFEKLRVFGGDISGFFVIQQDGESGLPFVFAAIKGNFGGVLVERFVLPVQAAQYRLAAFTTVLKGNASNLRCYKFVWAFRRRGILILCAGGGFGLNHGSGRRNGHFFFFCGGGLK